MNATQVIVTLVAVLALGAAAVGVLAFGSEDAPARMAQDGPATSATPSPDQPTTTPPAPTPTPDPTQVSIALAQPLPDRESCDEIRGTDYRSPAEREFFLANCTETEVPAPAAVSVAAPSVSMESAGGCETNVEIVTSRTDQTYDVSGASLDEVADSLDANAPQLEGSAAYGLTEYAYGLDGSYCAGANGSCHVGAIMISAEITVTLPHLTSQISGEDLQIWTAYVEQVTLHENRHVRILEEGLEEIKRQLLAINDQPDCDRVDHEVDKVWTLGGSQIQQRQRAFHIADERGQGGLIVQ